MYVSLSAAATGVFLDIDECKIPEELTAADIVPRIRQKLLDVGLRGPPASIRIYGDLTGLDFQSPDLKLNQFHAGHVNIYIYKICFTF